MKIFALFFCFSVVFCQDFFFSQFPGLQRFRERKGSRPNRKITKTTVPPLPRPNPIEFETQPIWRPQAISTPSIPPSEDTCDCGVENGPTVHGPGVTSRIVGGLEVRPRNRYPWMALLTDKGESVCGGAVINDRYIVTAAHCIDVCEEQIEDCKIVLGVHNVSEGKNTYEIEKVVKHEEYRLFINDIGLIKVKKQIKFNEAVKPICLPDQQHPKNIKPYEQSIMTAGWGLTGTGKASDVLMHFITTDGLKDERSKSRFCKDLLCLKPGSGRFESGDSGGPAWITVDDRAVIIGIVSHYRLHKMRLTRVPLVKDWIMKNTESARYCQ